MGLLLVSLHQAGLVLQWGAEGPTVHEQGDTIHKAEVSAAYNSVVIGVAIDAGVGDTVTA